MSGTRHDQVRPRDGGSLIAQVHQLSGRVFSKILKKHGIAELNPAQGRIVYALWKEEPLSQSQLAERTRLDKSTLTAMLERLESAGQIRRAPDPDDRRTKLVHLTERNRTMHGTYTQASMEMLTVFYASLDDAEIDAFERTLRKVLGNLENRERAPSA